MKHNWNLKEIWRLEGKSFKVEVVRWSCPIPEDCPKPIKSVYTRNHWNVYATVWGLPHASHPLFSRIDQTEDYYQDAVSSLHWHGGPTFMKLELNSSREVIGAQMGSDYMHWRDDRFETISTKEDAWEVFSDAEMLYEQLSTMEKEQS